MIVCSCNVITDNDIRDAVHGAADGPPRSAAQIYGCLGCSAQCGRCARTIRKIVTEALGVCATACAAECPHAQRRHAAPDHAPHTLKTGVLALPGAVARMAEAAV